MGFWDLLRRRPFLTPQERDQIAAALAGIDRYTSARIALRIDERPQGNPAARASRLLQAWDLPEDERARAVLIYACAANRQFAVAGGEEIRRVAPQAFWIQVDQDLRHHFQEERYCDGFFKALAQVARQLQHHFPPPAAPLATDEPDHGP